MKAIAQVLLYVCNESVWPSTFVADDQTKTDLTAPTRCDDHAMLKFLQRSTADSDRHIGRNNFHSY
jgi:hypothetical protein